MVKLALRVYFKDRHVLLGRARLTKQDRISRNRSTHMINLTFSKGAKTTQGGKIFTSTNANVLRRHPIQRCALI